MAFFFFLMLIKKERRKRWKREVTVRQNTFLWQKGSYTYICVLWRFNARQYMCVFQNFCLSDLTLIFFILLLSFKNSLITLIKSKVCLIKFTHLTELYIYKYRQAKTRGTAVSTSRRWPRFIYIPHPSPPRPHYSHLLSITLDDYIYLYYIIKNKTTNYYFIFLQTERC